MSKFRTQYSERKLIHTNPGNPEVPTYVLDPNKPGRVLKENGLKNLQDEINSHRASVELSTLLQRYANGDETALNKVQGIYADVSEFPDTIHGWNDSFRRAKEQFDELPDGLKDYFGHNAAKFWSEFGTTEFAKTLDEYYKSVSAKQKKKGNNGNNNSNIDEPNSIGGNGGNLDE